MVLSVVQSGLAAFAAVNQGAAEMVSTAGSADSAAMLGAVATVVGPIGASYLAAYAPAQDSNLAATLQVASAHAGISAATLASSASFSVADDA
jgi:hypothetical protein